MKFTLLSIPLLMTFSLFGQTKIIELEKSNKKSDRENIYNIDISSEFMKQLNKTEIIEFQINDKEKFKFYLYPNFLCENAIHKTGSKIKQIESQPHTYYGYNNFGSIYLTININFIYGLVELNTGEKYSIKPRRFNEKNAKPMEVIFKLNEETNLEEGTCGVQKTLIKPNSIKPSDKMNGCKVIKFYIESDYSMVEHYGSVTDVNNRNIAVLNNAQSNFDNEFNSGIEFSVEQTLVHSTSSSDPYSSTLNISDLHNEFKNRLQSQNSDNQNIHQLWTRRDFEFGRDQEGNEISLPNVRGSATQPSTNSSSRVFFQTLQDYDVAEVNMRALISHETGHNLSAGHISSGQADRLYIMNATYGLSDNWNSSSISQINNRINVLEPQLNDCIGNESADLFGKVRDHENKVLKGTAVYLINSKGILAHNTTTSSKGDYSINNIFPGTYDIVYIHPSYQNVELENILFRAGVNLPIDIRMGYEHDCTETGSKTLDGHDFFSIFGSCSREIISPIKITTTISPFRDRTITVCENTFLQAAESVEIRKGTTLTVPKGSKLEMAIGQCNTIEND